MSFFTGLFQNRNRLLACIFGLILTYKCDYSAIPRIFFPILIQMRTGHLSYEIWFMKYHEIEILCNADSTSPIAALLAHIHCQFGKHHVTAHHPPLVINTTFIFHIYLLRLHTAYISSFFSITVEWLRTWTSPSSYRDNMNLVNQFCGVFYRCYILSGSSHRYPKFHIQVIVWHLGSIRYHGTWRLR